MYDHTLIVVTADHGIAFQVGVETRRSVSASNVEELTPVPLIVKAPGQRRGRVSRRAGADPRRDPHDRRPRARSARIPRRRPLGLLGRDAPAPPRGAHRRATSAPPSGSPRPAGRPGAERWCGGACGSSARAPPGSTPGSGPHRGLIGRPVSALARSNSAGVRAVVADARDLRNVRRASGVVPAQIAGELRGGAARRPPRPGRGGERPRGGRGASFHLRGDPREYYAMMVPEAVLREGANSVQVLEVTPDGRVRVLARV